MSLTTTTVSDPWLLECPFDPPHTHQLPGDWQFGGPDETDPRADARWQPTNYYYVSDRLELIHVSSIFFCDEEAIDNFTWVSSFGPDFRPKWIRARRPDGTVETLKVIYDPDTDEVFET